MLSSRTDAALEPAAMSRFCSGGSSSDPTEPLLSAGPPPTHVPFISAFRHQATNSFHVLLQSQSFRKSSAGLTLCSGSLCPRRPVTVARRPSWHLAGGGILLAWSEPPLAVRRSWSPVERKKLSRGALHRQNLARVRFSVGARRYGHFKQPCQRLYNYWAPPLPALVLSGFLSVLHCRLCAMEASRVTVNVCQKVWETTKRSGLLCVI